MIVASIFNSGLEGRNANWMAEAMRNMVVAARNVILALLIREAYEAEAFNIKVHPGGINSDRFYVVGHAAFPPS
jgi:hypothetical protein